MLKSDKDNDEIKNYTMLKNLKDNSNKLYNDVIYEKEQELLFVYSSKIKKLEEELVEKNDKLRKMEEKFKLFQDDFLYNLKVLEERDKELEKFEKTIIDLRKDNEQKKESIINLNFQINVKNKEISGLEEKHKKQEKIYEDSILKMKEEYKNECNNNEKVLNAKLNDYIQLTNDLRNQLTESLSKTKEQKVSYEEEIKKLKEEIFNDINNTAKNYESKILTLESNNFQLKNQLLSLQNYNIILEKDKNILMDKKSTMERNVYINHAKWKEKEKEFNNKLTEIIEENKKINNLLDENSNCIEEYKLTILQKENLLNASIKENNLLKGHIEELSKENYKALEDIKNLSKTIKNNKNEINSLSGELSRYKRSYSKQKNEINDIKKSQKEKSDEIDHIKETYEKQKNVLNEEINSLKQQLKDNENNYKNELEQNDKKWECKYQEIVVINNDNTKKMTSLLEEKNNYLEQCNELQKTLNTYVTEEMNKKKNQQLGIEIQKNIEKDLSDMDNLSRIDIELPQQLNINDTQINDNFNEIVYKDVSNEECDREDYKEFYENKKKEDIYAENQTLRQKIIELQDQNEELGMIIHQMRNDLENIQNNVMNNNENENGIKELENELQELNLKLQKKQNIIEELLNERSYHEQKLKNNNFEDYNYNIERNDCTSILKNYDRILHENKLLKEKLRDAITDLEYMNLERNKLVEISNELKAELKQYEESETNYKDTQTQSKIKQEKGTSKDNSLYTLNNNKTIMKKIPPKQSQRITSEQQQAQQKLKQNHFPIYQIDLKTENGKEVFQQYLKSKGVRNWNKRED